MTRVNRRVRVFLAVAVLGVCAAVASASAATAPPPIGAYTTKGAYSYVSAPALHPPKIPTDAPTRRGLAPGYFMTANFKNIFLSKPEVGQMGPLILDSHLRPVWFRPVSTSVYPINLRVQTYLGKPVLTWWEGVINSSGGSLSGAEHIVDNHYRTVKVLQATPGWILDIHDFVIKGGEGYAVAVRNVPYDLRPFGGPANGQIVDNAVQEYNIKTGRFVRTVFDMLSQVSPSESYAQPAPNGVFSPYTLNSVDVSQPGSLLLSARNTWTAYKVDIKSGKVDWRLGGKKSDFKMGPQASFEFQHDAHFQPHGEVSVFDDACCAITGPGKFAPPYGPSRGLFLKLSTTSHTAAVARQYTHSGLETGSQGSTELLPNGNVVVGWGQQPWFSEYSAQGKLLFDARFPDPDSSYRAYVQQWTGMPFYPPALAVRRHGRKTSVFASWNGATKVAAWRVLAGSRASKLKVVVKRARRNGFETAIGLKGRGPFFRVEALDGKGRVLGKSKVIRLGAKNPAPTPLY